MAMVKRRKKIAKYDVHLEPGGVSVVYHPMGYDEGWWLEVVKRVEEGGKVEGATIRYSKAMPNVMTAGEGLVWSQALERVTDIAIRLNGLIREAGDLGRIVIGAGEFGGVFELSVEGREAVLYFARRKTEVVDGR